jgi:hypothetical protein
MVVRNRGGKARENSRLRGSLRPENQQAARIAANLRRFWKNAKMLAHTIMPNRFFDKLGLPRLAGDLN